LLEKQVEKKILLAGSQGDQIGRILAKLVIVFFGQFLKFTKVAHIIGLIFFDRYV
jgi:hypothetical protein